MNTKTLSVSLGSENKAKIAAIGLSLARIFPDFTCTVNGISVPSGVTDQPMDVVETITGAENRAREVLKASPDCDYAIGIEGGSILFSFYD
jgi:non-canonical (house-cleaning) NTP pyrophosphatase